MVNIQEEWKQIKGFENLYEISNLGKVRTVSRMSVATEGKYMNQEIGLKPIVPSVSKTGYYRINLYDNYKRKTFLLHRLVALAFIPNTENKTQINHLDCNKSNNTVCNLEWVSAKQNIVHAVDNGLRADVKGAKNPMSKLIPENVLEIYNMEGKLKDIGIKFGVSNITVFDIKHGRRWGWLTKHPKSINKQQTI